MSRKKEIERELREISPFLSEMKKRDNPFKVPENYFQSLPDEVISNAGIERKPSVSGQSRLGRLLKSVEVLLVPKYALALASVTVLLLVGTYFLSNPRTSKTSSELFTKLSEEDIQNYIESNIEDFDLDLLVEAIGEGNVAAVPPLQLEEEEVEEYFEEILDEIELEELEDLL